MMQTVIAALTSALLATMIQTAGATPGVATEYVTGVVLEDGTGDVYRTVGETDVSTKVSKPRADIVRAVVHHATYQLRIRVRFADLRPFQPLDSENGLSAQIRTSSGRSLGASWQLGDSRYGTVTLFENHKRSACPGLRRQIDFAEDLVRLRIPRTCLGQPRWVRVQISHYLDTDEPPAEVSYTDNPHNHLEFPSSYTRRLYRG